MKIRVYLTNGRRIDAHAPRGSLKKTLEDMLMFEFFVLDTLTEGETTIRTAKIHHIEILKEIPRGEV